MLTRKRTYFSLRPHLPHLPDAFYADNLQTFLKLRDDLCLRFNFHFLSLAHIAFRNIFRFAVNPWPLLEHNFLLLCPVTHLPPPTKGLLLWEWKRMLPACLPTSYSHSNRNCILLELHCSLYGSIY